MLTILMLTFNYLIGINRELSEDSPGLRINQFPFEHLLTVKDLLCIVARRANKGKPIDEITMKTNPSWLPTTFNLKTELAQFVAFYLAQKSMQVFFIFNFDMIIQLTRGTLS